MHVGAHKTASTHMQRFLTDHAQELAEVGCGFVGPEQLRGALSYRRVHSRRNQRIFRRLVGVRDDFATILVSDENFCGTPQEMIGDQLYRNSSRARDLAGSIDREIGFLLVLRSPATWFSSLYSEYLKRNAYVPFDRFAPFEVARNFNFRSRFQWLEDCPPHLVSVTTFAPSSSQSDLQDTLRAFLGLSGGDPQANEELLNLYARRQRSDQPGVHKAAFSAEQQQAFSRTYAAAGATAATDLVRATRRDPTVGTRYSPFSIEQRDALDAAYAEDLEWAASLTQPSH